MSYHLGVDLGTTFTAAALSRDGRTEPVTLGPASVAVPTVAYLADNGQLVFGQPAVRRAATEPGRVAREFKRRVGDPTALMLGGTPYPAEMLMARLLATVVDQVTSTEGAAPASVAVTHPANWGEYKLDLLRQAIRHNNLTVDQLVPEPVAAATFYASQRDLAPGTKVAVYDLGGGTFDAAVVETRPDGFAIVGQPDGLERLGGIDFDHAVLQHVTASLGLNLTEMDPDNAALSAAVTQLRAACVDAKEALSTDTDVAIPVMLPELHTEVRLTRAEFEAMVRPTLEETLAALQRTISSARLTPQDVSAVLLVGGSSRIPLVGQLVAASLGRPIAVDARPKDAIPMGAATTAANAGATTEPAVTTPLPAAPVAPPAEAPVTAPLPPAAVAAPAGPPGGSPSDGMPAAAATSGSSNRGPLLIAGAVLVAAVGIVAALLLTRNDDDPAETTATTTPDTTAPPTTSDTDPTTDTTAGSDGTGLEEGLGILEGEGLDIGASGSGEPADPMPGDDWSPEARTHYVEECASTDAATMLPDAEAYCGCSYDELEDSDLSFDEVNEALVAEDINDVSDDARSAMESASLSCAMGA